METILYGVEQGVATITLNRPEKLIAITKDMASLFFDAIQETNVDVNVHVVLLHGAGRAFCAGSDIGLFSDGKDWSDPWAYHNKDLRTNYSRAIRLAAKPVVAAIHGHCLGGGLDLAAHSDIRIAARGTMIGAPENLRGWFAYGGKAQILPRLMGLGQAASLLLTGEPIDADEAYRCGLVQEVVDLDALMDRASALAHKIANQPSTISSMTKLALQASSNMGIDAGFAYENELSAISRYARARILAGDT